jgi:carotenoid cleavage dioxygenase-like enzyme
MATPYPSNDPYLSRGFEPIRLECDYADLGVDGTIPTDLNGSLYRIGPNPQFAPRGRYNPLQADGMIHAFHIQNGRVAYRNRWVRTRQWALERAAGRALFATSGDPRDVDPAVAGVRSDGVANTHIIWHGGRLLALEEGHAPFDIDPVSLDTRGAWTFRGELPGNMTAHPKVDPDSGDMLFFANFPTRRFDGAITFYVADAHGRLIRREIVQGPFPALVHDFAITKDFVVFVVCPLTLSLERARAGGAPIAWEPQRRTHVGIMPRRGRGDEVRWYTGAACMAWHTLNAFNDADRIVVDVCRQDAPAFPDADGTLPNEASLRQYLTRWTIDAAGSSEFTARRLSDVVCEYPRIDERRTGLPYRYGFVACGGGPGTGDPFHRAIARFDHTTHAMQTFHSGAGGAMSEPVFVARSGATTEADGYVLATVFDERRNASHLAIFDARHIDAGPIARAHLDHRIPLGFHGSWRQNPNA